MKLRIFLVLMASFLFINLPQTVWSANHYVRSGTTGNNSGIDWNNAYPDIPATLVRGDTYYVAGGTYGPMTYDDPLDSTKYIIIKKATKTDHGTDIGWTDIFGNTQAHFGRFYIRTGYYIFEGVTGSGNDAASYGFSVSKTSCEGDTRSELINFWTDTVSNVQISHFDVTNCGSAWDIPQYSLYNNSGGSSSITVSNNYFKNGSANILIRNWKNSTIENNYFDGNWSSAKNHGEQISPGSSCDDITLRNNTFVNSVAYVVGWHKDNNKRWNIYNNLIIGGSVTAGFGNADSGTYDVVKMTNVHHNTFVNVSFGGYGAFFVGTITNLSNDISFSHNNLFFNCNNPRLDDAGYTVGAIIHTHNSYNKSTGTYDGDEGGTGEVSSIDPFLDSTNGDFKLKSITMAGKMLPSTFILDRSGSTRINWDRGIFEYQGGINPPKSLRIAN